jgi:hypothetical protein
MQDFALEVASVSVRLLCVSCNDGSRLLLVHLGGVITTPAGAAAVLLVAAVAAAVPAVLLVPLTERLAAKSEVVVVDDGGLDPGLGVEVGLGHVVVVVRVCGRHGCGFCRLWCHFVVVMILLIQRVLSCFAHSTTDGIVYFDLVFKVGDGIESSGWRGDGCYKGRVFVWCTFVAFQESGANQREGRRGDPALTRCGREKVVGGG